MRAPFLIGLLLVFASACGRRGYELLVADAEVPDATVPDAMVPDGMVPDAGCVLGPWQAPEPLTIADTEGATLFGGPSPTVDRRTLYFSMELENGPENIYFATRADIDSAAFGAPTPVESVNTSDTEGAPFISADGLTLYFFADGGGGLSGRDIFYATRPSTGSAFGAPIEMPNVNDVDIDQTPAVSLDGLMFVFSSRRAGSEDLYLADRASVAVDFDGVRRIDELASAGRDSGASFSPDALSLYYASSRTGSLGGIDVWVAARDDTGSPFNAPENLEVLNTEDDEFDVRVAADEREIFFVSDRDGFARLYRALRACLP